MTWEKKDELDTLLSKLDTDDDMNYRLSCIGYGIRNALKELNMGYSWGATNALKHLNKIVELFDLEGELE